jgi:Na+/proline symporter/nitrogen-specific signal transduction histidine kinase
MLSTNVVLFTSLAYVALLFLIAFVSDARARRGRAGFITASPIVYTLSISVYCTSWTFYGAVGSAARNGLEFATIYLGPTLVFVGWWFLLRKLVRIGRVHRITSIADLISSRYGKSTTLGVLVTVIALVSTTPYIALQLKAVTSSFEVVSNAAGLTAKADFDINTAFWVAAAMALFTILFGTRNIDANERNHGVVAAIAFEALVKLVALIAVGLFVVLAVGNGLSDLFGRPTSQAILRPDVTFGPRWLALTVLSACAIFCLPRQFQITVVENSDERHLRTASWMFPLYLFMISLFILPIAVAGLATLPASSNPDMYVLTLPMARGQEGLALFAFIGGFSSATSMVIVATIALSIMVSNHIVMPISLRLPRGRRSEGGDVKQLLLVSRRISIAVTLLLGFLYFRLSSKSEALAAIGLIAFSGVAQLVPSILGGLYWRQATARGAIVGMTVGTAVWAYTLVVPSFATGTGVLADFVAHGPWGIALLRPQALFGLTGFDPLVHALFWSLTVNAGLYLLVSLSRDARPLERLQGALFVDVFRHPVGDESRALPRSARIDDLYVLARRIMGADAARRLFDEFARQQGMDDGPPRPDAAFIVRLERALAGSIGAATAHAMVSQVATGGTISLEEVIKIVDETQQVIEHSHQLEQKSQELQVAAAQLREANERLKQLDAQKNDFLSQVSHELRTPMTSIRSFAEILLETPDLNSEQARRFLTIVQEESLRLTRLLDEILDLGHLESGQLKIDIVPVNAETAFDGALETCRGMARQFDVELIDGERVPSAIVNADTDRLRQVFINLLSNAIKYNTNPRPRVTVRSCIDGDRYHAYIRDNGPGIDRKDRESIFSKFSRGWERTARQSSGAGLGLAISRQIIRNLNGELDLEEVDGPGACFRVSLPVALPD